MLSLNRAGTSSPSQTESRSRTLFTRTHALAVSLALVGSLAVLPLTTYAGKVNGHQALVAAHKIQVAPSRAALALLPTKAQTAHQARLAKMLVAHKTQAAAHQAKVAARLAARQARQAKIAAAHQARIAQKQARLAAARQQAAVRMAKVEAQHRALTSGNVVEAAYSLRGTRYVMGGTSRSGFDCSGFVRYILSTTGGVDVPRTAAEQFYKGATIAPQDMQPGDLVFFKNTYKRGISHVGIYAGGGKFIHAANAHKGVRMDDLNAPYYWGHFAGARRVLPAQMRSAAMLASPGR